LKDYTEHLIPDNRPVLEALNQINRLSGDLDMTLLVCDANGRMVGTLTDGDIRRGFISGLQLSDFVSSFMVKNFKFLKIGHIDVLYIRHLREKNIRMVPLLDDEGKIVQVYDFSRRRNVLPVDAVLMAGGRGERLRPLTDNTPKPMLLVGGKPIIEHNIDNLMINGVDSFFITVNYLADQIESYFDDGSEKGIHIQCIRETKPLGTIGSVSLINDFANDTVLIMNSDLFTNIDFEDFYLDFAESGADMSVASVPYNVSVPYAILNLNEKDVESFEEKPTYTFYANAGIYLIKRELLKSIPLNEHYNTTDFMQALLDVGKKVIKFPIIGYWIDIGKREDYAKACEFAKHLKDEYNR
jgi:dTDP-glucose pyrophosphorylase